MFNKCLDLTGSGDLLEKVSEMRLGYKVRGFICDSFEGVLIAVGLMLNVGSFEELREMMAVVLSGSCFICERDKLAMFMEALVPGSSEWTFAELERFAEGRRLMVRRDVRRLMVRRRFSNRIKRSQEKVVDVV